MVLIVHFLLSLFVILQILWDGATLSNQADEEKVKNYRELFPGDYLTPYSFLPNGQHRRSIRSQDGVSIRDTGENDSCEPMIQGKDLDVEVGRASGDPTSGIEKRQFADDVSFNRVILGSIIYVNNPLYTVSLFEPFELNSCTRNPWSLHRATVTDTAKRRNQGCKVAVNAGYFVVPTGVCLGNVVSEGHVVQTAKNIKNANFGIRQDGSFMTGYIPDEEVLSGEIPFKQLVSGILWLVRNGSNYVNVSMREECRNNQDTGSMKIFAECISARSAVGHDRKGRLVIAKIEGQTFKRGISLFEFADLLIRHDVVNAINLDGGGSSQLIMDGTLASYPSDHCIPHPEFRCEREVSTILCVHDVQCMDNCSNHGNCDEGECSCHSPWHGITCNTLNCSLTNCSGHGTCSDGKCECDGGWKGDFCEEACSGVYFGPGCKRYCSCYWKQHAHCDPVTAECVCDPGWTGYSCNTPCEEGHFGQDCRESCSNCSYHGQCSRFNGSCICLEGWTGEYCHVPLTQPSSTTASNNTDEPTAGLHGNHTGSSHIQPSTSSSRLPQTISQDVSASELYSKGTVYTSPHQTSTNTSTVCDREEVASFPMSQKGLAALVTLSLGSLLLHVLLCAVTQCLCSHLHKRKKRQVRDKRRKKYYTRLQIDECSDSNQ